MKFRKPNSESIGKVLRSNLSDETKAYLCFCLWRQTEAGMTEAGALAVCEHLGLPVSVVEEAEKWCMGELQEEALQEARRIIEDQ